MFALFEDRMAQPGSAAGWLFDEFIEQVEGNWDVLNQSIEAAQALGRWVVVALNYELGEVFESSIARVGSTNGVHSVGRVWIFGKCIELDADTLSAFLQHQLSNLPGSERVAGVGGLEPSMTQTTHAKAIEAIHRYIQAGDCYQVNLTFPVHFSYFGSPLALYCGLREQQPARYGGLIFDPIAPVLSLSPELFFEKKQNLIVTRPMKGTAERKSSEDQDHLAGKSLQASEKNRAENLMIVDLLRNDLSRLRTIDGTQPTVSVTELFALEAYPSVWQMVSQIEARWPLNLDQQPENNNRLSADNLLRALFPCGSITGAPKIRAMQIIKELESDSRGLYSGTIGWFAPNGDCRLNVAIRTLTLEVQGAASGIGVLGIGGGIVQDSMPEDEWDECWLKARFLTQLDSQLRLIETLRFDRGFPLLEQHIERLTRSASWLGFVCNPVDVRDRLTQLSKGALASDFRSPLRVRLMLDRWGNVETQTFPLLPEPRGDRWVQIATHRVDQKHPLQGHKTTWREYYDEALAEISETPSCFDCLFFNQRGELVEGARSSVFILQAGVWKTPPLSSGALPGVWRSEVLQGRVDGMENAVEAVLQMKDLQTAERIVCGNALRGAVEVKLRS